MKTTIAQQLKIKDFPFVIKDKDGNIIYHEDYDGGYWCKREYDARGNWIRYETSNSYWIKREYDARGNLIRHEDSNHYWYKNEYDANGNRIRYEDSDGKIMDNRPKTDVSKNLNLIDAWENKIASLVEDYKQLIACCDAAYDVGVLDTDGKLNTAIWSTYDNMLQYIDVAGWISWYMFDNACGDNGLKASYVDEIIAVKTPRDLARLIVNDLNQH